MSDEPAVAVSGKIDLLLFIAASSPSTVIANSNLRAALAEYPAELFRLEVVDVATDPFRALKFRVLVTPTLLASTSGRRLVGDFSEREIVAYFLNTVASSA